MRYVSTIAFLIAALAASFPAMAAGIETPSHAVAVTVYPDRATVTREATVSLPEGASTVAITGLPATLFPNSLRAEGHAEAAVILGALDSKTVNGADLAEARERELQANLQHLQDQRAMVEADRKAGEAKQKFLAEIGKAGSGAANDDIGEMDLKPEQWAAAADTIFTQTDATLRAAAEYAMVLRHIDEQIAAARADLDKVQTGQRGTIDVSVPVEATAATTLTLRVTYQIPAATWSPLYDARLDTGTGKLALTEYGEVRQSTGEDWTGVALTLSTAQPAEGAMPPKVQTEWIDVSEPVMTMAAVKEYRLAAGNVNQQMMDAALANGAAMPAAAPMMMARKASVEARFQTAAIDTGGYVTEYKIPGPATVTADDTARRVMIGTVDATATVVDQVRPALDTNAYIVARAKIDGDAPLLPGQANLFRDGAYVGNASLPLVRPGEETPLGFGIDDQMVVKRQVLEDTKGTAGLFSKDKQRTRKVVTSLHNLHKYPVKAEVLEALPVSRNDQVKVEILSPDTTEGYAKDAETTTGLALWTLDLAPDAKGEVKLGWQVSWPPDRQLTGLP